MTTHDTATASIIIPAYNEGRTIDRCLEGMLAGARPGELDIIVVCNGCSDDTAERARRYQDRGVRVVETAVASKPNALNLGDDVAITYPRFYIDADIEIESEAIRDVTAFLGQHPDVLLAAPTAIVTYHDRSMMVRSFYEVWTRLPYFTGGVTGGVYAFSEEGRKRFDRFPEVIADDGFVKLQVAPHEHRCSPRSTYKIHPPTNLRDLLAIKTRARAGNYELQARFPELQHNRSTSPARSLGVILRTPRLWRHAPIYLGVMALAKLRAHRKLRNQHHGTWERDDSSRASSGTAGNGPGRPDR